MATERSFTARENLLNMMRATHNNQLIEITEVLNEVNPILSIMPTIESTDMLAHVGARRTALPAPQWTKLGNGWSPTVATQQQVTEGMGILKNRFQLNADLAKKYPDPEGYRRQQERAFIEGMSQEMANTFIYGNKATAPEEFTGLAPRYASTSTAGVYDNGQSSGSTCTSIWLIQPDPADCALLRPRFDPNMGLVVEDKGLVLDYGDNWDSTTNKNKKAWHYITEFEWTTGLWIGDTRRVKRICNIEASATTGTYAVNTNVLIEAINSFRTPGQIHGFCSQMALTQLQINTDTKPNVHFLPDAPYATPAYEFLGVILHLTEAITDSESVLS